MTTTKQSKSSGIKPPEDGFVQVNIRLTSKQHRALKIIGALTGKTLAESVGELAIDEAERQGLTAMLDE